MHWTVPIVPFNLLQNFLHKNGVLFYESYARTSLRTEDIPPGIPNPLGSVPYEHRSSTSLHSSTWSS